MSETAEHREPTDAERKAFLRAGKALAALGRTGLHIYMDDGTLNLMTGPAHSGGGTAHPERVREHVLIPNGDAGAW